MTPTPAEYAERINRKNKISGVLFLLASFTALVISVLAGLVFIVIFGAIAALFSGVLGNRAAAESPGFSTGELLSIALFLVFCAAATIVPLVAGIALLTNARWARTAGIVAFFTALLTFAPVALVLAYPLVFLLGDDGKYLYKTAIKK